MSKNRRDSLASELEEKLKDAKAFNQKYRKQLLETETELKVRKLQTYSNSLFYFITFGNDTVCNVNKCQLSKWRLWCCASLTLKRYQVQILLSGNPDSSFLSLPHYFQENLG
jgi:hypothetical protein